MSGRILVVDDEKSLLIALRGLLSREGYQVETASSGEEALRRIETGSFHLVDHRPGDGRGRRHAGPRARPRVDPDTAVVMITAYGSEKTAVQAMKLGARDYIPKPFDNDELRVVVAPRDGRRAAAPRPSPPAGAGARSTTASSSIVGDSPAMRRVFETIDRRSPTPT